MGGETNVSAGIANNPPIAELINMGVVGYRLLKLNAR